MAKDKRCGYPLRGRASNGLENIVELGVLRCCSKCKKTKLVEDFSVNNRSPDKRRSWCKECFNKQAKSYNKKYVDENHVHELERHRNYHDENREIINERARIRNSEDPVPRRNSIHKRRLNKINQSPISSEKIIFDDWQKLITKHNNSCAYCGTSDRKLTMDHVVPLSRGGLHSIENLLPACLSCNVSKGNRLLSELQNSGLLIEKRMAAFLHKERIK